MAPWRPRHALLHSTTIHTSPQSHYRGQACSETVATVSQWYVQHLSSSRAGDSATCQSFTGYHCSVQGEVMCNLVQKQTALSLSSFEAEFYAASACTGEFLGLAELFKDFHCRVSVRLGMDSDSARHILERR